MAIAFTLKNNCRAVGVVIWLSVLVFAILPTAIGGNSPVETAPLRLRIERDKNSAWPATMGTVEVAPSLNASGSFGVFTAAGKPVAFQTYWTAPGEPSRIRFDTSGGAKTYYLCFDTNLPSAPGGWRPEAGVLLETRACAAQPIRTLPQIEQLLNTAGPPLGRDYFPEIFLGGNPFGVSAYYIASFTGWFRTYKSGSYSFATLSTHASFLQVDGKDVTQWLGRHSMHTGRAGQHNGEIALLPGLHRLNYTQIQLDGRAAAEAAWQPPGASNFKLMTAGVFVPVANFRVTGFESTKAAAPPYFEWHTSDHCALDDAMAIRVHFRIFDHQPRNDYRWRFDDGTEAQGADVYHFFPQPGLRQVTLTAWKDGGCLATNTIRIRVAPRWLQRDWWSAAVFGDASNDFLRRDLSRTPAADLTAIIALAEHADNRVLATKAGQAMLNRANEFKFAAAGIVFYKLGLRFEHQGDAGDVLAEKSFRLAIAPERASAASPSARLKLADLLIHSSGNFDGAEKLLGSIYGNNLTDDEQRLLRLLKGDLLLARGKIDEARKQFLAVGKPPNQKTLEATAAARLESASILLEHDQFDDAQATLEKLTFEFPEQRMSLGTGLLKIQLALNHKEFQRAFTACRLLAPIAENELRQSELLYDTVESGMAIGKTDEARGALAQLLKNFPYSEAAANAKAKWSQL